jgi:hypothetical protein
MIDDLNVEEARILDLKTTGDASLDGCSKHMWEHGYDIQCEAYISAIETIFPKLVGRVEFLDLFCEMKPPYVVTPVRAAGLMREIGRKRWQRAIARWAFCSETNVWPPYVQMVAHIDPPRYALYQEGLVGD